MNELVVFAKYWEAGNVKTRLAKSIGLENAANVYRAFLDCILHRFVHTGDVRSVCVTPPERVADFANLIGDRSWTVTKQPDGDLGHRMASMFAERLDRTERISRVVLVGSDSPNLPVSIMNKAFRMLQEHDVVLGPTTDGGYYLVGQSTYVPEMFHEIQWSTPQVWSQSLAAIAATSHSLFILPEWSDVDDHDDMIALSRWLEVRAGSDSALLRLRENLNSITQ